MLLLGVLHLLESSCRRVREIGEPFLNASDRIAHAERGTELSPELEPRIGKILGAVPQAAGRLVQLAKFRRHARDELLRGELHLLDHLGVGRPESVLHGDSDLRHALGDLIDFLGRDLALRHDLRERQAHAFQVRFALAHGCQGIAEGHRGLAGHVGAHARRLQGHGHAHGLGVAQAGELCYLAQGFHFLCRRAAGVHHSRHAAPEAVHLGRRLVDRASNVLEVADHLQGHEALDGRSQHGEARRLLVLRAFQRLDFSAELLLLRRESLVLSRPHRVTLRPELGHLAPERIRDALDGGERRRLALADAVAGLAAGLADLLQLCLNALESRADLVAENRP